MAKLTEALDTAPAATAPTGTSLCLCEQYARVTEGAALGGARWLGRADQEAAERGRVPRHARARSTTSDQRTRRDRRRGGGPARASATEIGAGGEDVDLALDPLEGRGVVARGGNGAMSMIAVGEPGSLLNLPDMYMRKIAVGPRARGSIDLLRPIGENVQAIADAFGRRAERHHHDRSRPSAAPRPDRGDPRLRRTHQADSGRRRSRRRSPPRSAARTTIWRSASAAPGRP